MKKTTRIVFAALSAFMLAGCGVSQNLADKINSAAATKDTKDDYTLDQLKKKLGEPTVSILTAKTWVAGAKDLEDALNKNEAGKEQKALTVVFNLDGKAISATYGVWDGKSK